MIDLILKSIWLILPAAVANISPVLFKWLPLLNRPVDGGKLFRNKPLFGRNKTYRGFLVGTLMAIVIVYIQTLFANRMDIYSILNYQQVNVWYVGFLFGFGALFGDIIKSFFKRQAGINFGKSWPPFDQIDWIIGSLVFIHLFYQAIPWQIWITGTILFGTLHPIVNIVGYWLGIKRSRF